MVTVTLKKLRERKGLATLMVLSAVLFYIASDLAWSGLTHRGPGWWKFGGDEPGTGGWISTPEYWERIPEAEYRRQSLGGAGILLIVGALFLYAAIKAWRERSKLEAEWERVVANPGQLLDARKHPYIYGDGFKIWMKRNHPEVKL